MASFKDLLISGVSRFIGKIYAPNGIVGDVDGVANNIKAGGTSGQVLTSNGSDTLPSWKNQLVTSVASKTGAVTLAKSDVGLGSVVNTGDSATPVSGGTTKFTTGGAYTELNKKLDKDKMWVGTQSEYDSITTKDSTTFYFIKE